MAIVQRPTAEPFGALPIGGLQGRRGAAPSPTAARQARLTIRLPAAPHLKASGDEIRRTQPLLPFLAARNRARMIALHHHPFCPHSRFIRLVLGEMGIEPRLVEEKAGIGAASSC